MRMPSQATTDAWKNFSKETESEYGVKLAGAPAADGPFAQMAPSAFKVADAKLKGFGADVAKLPQPAKDRSE
jgi:hypothetical protein